MKHSFLFFFAFLLTSQVPFAAPQTPKIEKIRKTDAEWKKILTPEQFRIMRSKGTEIACSGEYWQNKKDGVYVCAACRLPLFDSKDKFESKTGWPSFMRPFAAHHIIENVDKSHGMVRTELDCARCDGHLGHVFDDGPRPTGLRYCINSVSMAFVPRNEFQKEKP